VTVLHDDVPIADRARVTEHLTNGLGVEWVDVAALLPDAQPMAGLPHVSRSTFARVLCSEAVPPHVNRLVYLDGDVLIRRSISPLFEHDLGGRPLAACLDLNAPTMKRGLHTWERFGLSPDRPYFNAGVLVIDVAAWRRDQLTEQATAIAAAHRGQFHWGDQDVLNILLDNRWSRLPAEWNLLWGGWGRRVDPRGVPDSIPKAEFERAHTDPAIVHFAGSVKPWHARYGGAQSTRWFGEWELHARRTPFENQLLGGPRRRIERAFWSPWVRPVDAALRLVRRTFP
jgi:lipopolysaccharide biosynthesis glycosyltransferase